ncbi:MAG: N-6 DNA methylase, partial [bacterium]
YYPESPYEFSVLPADILGSVYERFLGKTIRLTDGHQAKIEEKPEVRKAGGVYYTPSYIVDYIVQNTLGKLLTPEAGQHISLPDAAKLKVVDPACGSGSFLIVAYQFLLDWHRDRYAESPDKWSKGKTATLYQAKGGEWRLTTAEKKRI